MKNKMKIEQNRTIIDFFSGAGGFTLGALRAGFNVVGALEIDDLAMDTHARNFPVIKHCKIDLSKISPQQLRKSFMLKQGELCGIIGGPPCQGFSSIGHRNIHDDRNNLFVRFFEFVREFRPTFFIAENVLGILTDKFKNILEESFNKLPRSYTILAYQIVKANEYGAPTTRSRAFFIGYDSKRMNPLAEEDFLKAKVPEAKRICVQDALIGLPEDISLLHNGVGQISVSWKDVIQNNRCSDFYKRIYSMVPKYVGDKNILGRYRSQNMVSGCIPTKHSCDVINRYSELKYGQRDKISKSVKLDPEGFCPTLRSGTGPDKGSFQAVRPIHFNNPRVITPREAARLQGFPDWFDFQPTIWHSFRQIGNSVSPIVAERILSIIRHKLT